LSASPSDESDVEGDDVPTYDDTPTNNAQLSDTTNNLNLQSSMSMQQSHITQPQAYQQQQMQHQVYQHMQQHQQHQQPPSYFQHQPPSLNSMPATSLTQYASSIGYGNNFRVASSLPFSEAIKNGSSTTYPPMMNSAHFTTHSRNLGNQYSGSHFATTNPYQSMSGPSMANHGNTSTFNPLTYSHSHRGSLIPVDSLLAGPSSGPPQHYPEPHQLG